MRQPHAPGRPLLFLHELRLQQVWVGEASLLRQVRGIWDSHLCAIIYVGQREVSLHEDGNELKLDAGKSGGHW